MSNNNSSSTCINFIMEHSSRLFLVSLVLYLVRFEGISWDMPLFYLSIAMTTSFIDDKLKEQNK